MANSVETDLISSLRSGVADFKTSVTSNKQRRNEGFSALQYTACCVSAVTYDLYGVPKSCIVGILAKVAEYGSADKTAASVQVVAALAVSMSRVDDWTAVRPFCKVRCFVKQ